jgi:hypothetical protein
MLFLDSQVIGVRLVIPPRFVWRQRVSPSTGAIISTPLRILWATDLGSALLPKCIGRLAPNKIENVAYIRESNFIAIEQRGGVQLAIACID